jgi:hypothetical protein
MPKPCRSLEDATMTKKVSIKIYEEGGWRYLTREELEKYHSIGVFPIKQLLDGKLRIYDGDKWIPMVLKEDE